MRRHRPARAAVSVSASARSRSCRAFTRPARPSGRALLPDAISSVAEPTHDPHRPSHSILLSPCSSCRPAPAKPTSHATCARRPTAFLAALDAGQRGKATFAFGADERLNWLFVPRERKGLPLYAMTPGAAAGRGGAAARRPQRQGLREGRAHPHARGRAGRGREARRPWSRSGTAVPIAIASATSSPSSARRRADKPWGWRYEGHHVSQNWTVVGGSAIASSPQFFGSNPAEVRTGPLKGLRVLARRGGPRAHVPGVARRRRRRRQPWSAPRRPKDILTSTSARPAQIDDRGIAWPTLTPGQQKLLTRVIEEYAFAQAPSSAQARMTRVRKAPRQPPLRLAGFDREGRPALLPRSGRRRSSSSTTTRRTTATTSTRSGATTRATSAATCWPSTTSRITRVAQPSGRARPHDLAADAARGRLLARILVSRPLAIG